MLQKPDLINPKTINTLYAIVGVITFAIGVCHGINWVNQQV